MRNRVGKRPADLAKVAELKQLFRRENSQSNKKGADSRKGSPNGQQRILIQNVRNPSALSHLFSKFTKENQKLKKQQAENLNRLTSNFN